MPEATIELLFSTLKKSLILIFWIVLIPMHDLENKKDVFLIVNQSPKSA